MCIRKRTRAFNLEEAIGPERIDDPLTKQWTPMDWFLYYKRCCFCVRLRIAAVIICCMSFFWGAAEMIAADKFITRMYSKKDTIHLAITSVYRLIIVGFLLASVVLAIGIAKKNYRFITIYVWCGFVFLVVYLLIHIVHLVFLMINKKVTMYRSFRIVGCVIWCCYYFYLLIIVNSFRLSMWIFNHLINKDYYTDVILV